MKTLSPLQRVVLAAATAAALSFSVELARATGAELPTCKVTAVFKVNLQPGLYSTVPESVPVADISQCAARAIVALKDIESPETSLVSLYFNYEEERFTAEGKLTTHKTVCQIQAALKRRGSIARKTEWKPLEEILPDYFVYNDSLNQCYDSAKGALTTDDPLLEITKTRFSFPYRHKRFEITVQPRQN